MLVDKSKGIRLQIYICPLPQFSKSADDNAKTEGTFIHYVLFLAVLEYGCVFSATP